MNAEYPSKESNNVMEKGNTNKPVDNFHEYKKPDASKDKATQTIQKYRAEFVSLFVGTEKNAPSAAMKTYLDIGAIKVGEKYIALSDAVADYVQKTNRKAYQDIIDEVEFSMDGKGRVAPDFKDKAIRAKLALWLGKNLPAPTPEVKTVVTKTTEKLPEKTKIIPVSKNVNNTKVIDDKSWSEAKLPKQGGGKVSINEKTTEKTVGDTKVITTVKTESKAPVVLENLGFNEDRKDTRTVEEKLRIPVGQNDKETLYVALNEEMLRQKYRGNTLDLKFNGSEGIDWKYFSKDALRNTVNRVFAIFFPWEKDASMVTSFNKDSKNVNRINTVSDADKIYEQKLIYLNGIAHIQGSSLYDVRNSVGTYLSDVISIFPSKEKTNIEYEKLQKKKPTIDTDKTYETKEVQKDMGQKRYHASALIDKCSLTPENLAVLKNSIESGNSMRSLVIDAGVDGRPVKERSQKHVHESFLASQTFCQKTCPELWNIILQKAQFEKYKTAAPGPRYNMELLVARAAVGLIRVYDDAIKPHILAIDPATKQPRMSLEQQREVIKNTYAKISIGDLTRGAATGEKDNNNLDEQLQKYRYTEMKMQKNKDK